MGEYSGSTNWLYVLSTATLTAGASYFIISLYRARMRISDRRRQNLVSHRQKCAILYMLLILHSQLLPDTAFFSAIYYS